MDKAKFKVFNIITSDSDNDPSVGLIFSGLLLIFFGVGILIIPFTLGQATHFNHDFDWVIYLFGVGAFLGGLYCFLWCFLNCRYLKKLFLRSEFFECKYLSREQQLVSDSEGAGVYVCSIKYEYILNGETHERKTKKVFSKRQAKKIAKTKAFRKYYDIQKDEAMYTY